MAFVRKFGKNLAIKTKRVNFAQKNKGESITPDVKVNACVGGG